MTKQTIHKDIPPKALYKNSYKNTLVNVRKHHRLDKKAFSGLIHANGMDKTNEFLESTLLHPKLILSAVVIGLIGEIINVSSAEIFSYNYNYLLFIYFFMFGYIVSALYLVVISRLRK
ncbi:MAG TPA: hypothetical protein VMQ58_02265 [Candidatus Saccharimonadales bacterium]|jgi:arginine exporter protein ArgO|nr:hypothetical protein [Candidatus Saccharimonadales bacterium]